MQRELPKPAAERLTAWQRRVVLARSAACARPGGGVGVGFGWVRRLNTGKNRGLSRGSGDRSVLPSVRLLNERSGVKTRRTAQHQEGASRAPLAAALTVQGRQCRVTQWDLGYSALSYR